MRRLFWSLIIAVERPVARIVAWSRWRRWHQAWARYHHYRRRDHEPEPAPLSTYRPTVTAQVDVQAIVWARLAALLPPMKRMGRPYTHDRRVVLEAIIHVMRTGCRWQRLPAPFPPGKTVYSQFTRWRANGIWAKIWENLDEPRSVNQLQL